MDAWMIGLPSVAASRRPPGIGSFQASLHALDSKGLLALMSRFLFGMIAGASLLYLAMHYHVVRGNDGVFLVSKISNNLSDVYADTREFSLNDWKDHKPLAAAIMQSNQSHLLEDASLDSFRVSVQGLVDGLFSNR